MGGGDHSALICQGQCSISNKSLMECAENLSTRLRDANLLSSTAVCRNYPEIDQNSAFIQLYNGALLSNKYLYLAFDSSFIQSESQKAEVAQTIVSLLSSASRQSRQFVLQDVFLMFYAVERKDAGMLSEILQKCPLPRCLLQASLLDAIWKYFDEGVNILLNSGASPVDNLRLGYSDTRPIQVCMHSFCEPYLNAIITTPHHQEEIEARARSLTTSLKNLLTHAPQSPDGTYGMQALQELYQLGLFSADAVEMMIEWACQSFKYEFEFESPLAYAFEYLGYDIDNGRLRNGFPLPVAIRIFENCVIPLVRAGCRQRSDEALHNDFGTKCGFLFRLILSERSDLLDVFQEVAIESRSNQAMPLEVSHLLNENQEEFPDEVRSFLNRFPRTLQSFARRAVLSCLCFGSKRRNDAIDSLVIPNSLRNYLKFKELDLKSASSS